MFISLAKVVNLGHRSKTIEATWITKFNVHDDVGSAVRLNLKSLQSRRAESLARVDYDVVRLGKLSIL